ncbi:MAG: hypothetical protein HFH72_15585 [Lachnospiraceae bacterium]|nr:hypothetical protein [Lachnospiraceae bacterium]
MGKKSSTGAKGGKKSSLGDIKAAKKKENKEEALQENEEEQPDYVKQDRVPQDKETFLAGDGYQKTGRKVKGASVYKKGDRYYYRDTLHKGKRAHVEVFDGRGRHLGEANPISGRIAPGSMDPSKTINLK